jgi:hypoxanthine-guanine phosphoribosyltransferase
MNASPNARLRQVISADQIQKRVRELGRQISDDYRGQTVIALGILENSFLFMADLVRAVDVPVICAFIKPSYKQSKQGDPRCWRYFSATNWPLQASMCCWSRAWCIRE